MAPVVWNGLLLSGLLLLPLMLVQVGMVQVSQLWVVMALAVLLQQAQIRVSLREALVYAMFMGFALVATLFAGYSHFKVVEQLIKFGFLYPAFFLVGRALGGHYRQAALPHDTFESLRYGGEIGRLGHAAIRVIRRVKRFKESVVGR
jgi:hypothetical protein